MSHLFFFFFFFSDKPLKLVRQFTNQGSNISSTESDNSICIAKACMVIVRLLIIRSSDLLDKLKHDFFESIAVSVPLDECTTWSLTKSVEKKLNVNYSRIVHAVSNKSLKQDCCLPPI